MYGKVQVVDIAERAAAQRIMQDRKRYLPFLAAAERAATADNMVVGGNTATQLLLGETLGIDDFRYELFSVNPHRDARRLADALYRVEPDGLGQLTTMYTAVLDEEYSISVNERPLITVRALVRGKHRRQVRTAQDVIAVSERPGLVTGAPVQCMGAEIQLITTYAQMSNPSVAGTWSALLKTESRLRDTFAEEIATKIAATLRQPTRGGRERPPAAIAQLRRAIRALAAKPGRALVGDAANDNERLQLVTSAPLTTEAKLLVGLGRKIGVRVEAAVNDPGVPTQMRLRRLTVYRLQKGGRRSPVADVFNLGEYEVVPTTQDSGGLRTVTLPVTLRIRLVDLWTAQLLQRQGKMKRSGGQLHALAQKYQREAAEFSRRTTAARTRAEFEQLFPLSPGQYIGQHVNPILHQKRVRFRLQQAERKQRAERRGKNTKRVFVRSSYPYYPAAAALKAAERERDGQARRAPRTREGG